MVNRAMRFPGTGSPRGATALYGTCWDVGTCGRLRLTWLTQHGDEGAILFGERDASGLDDGRYSQSGFATSFQSAEKLLPSRRFDRLHRDQKIFENRLEISRGAFLDDECRSKPSHPAVVMQQAPTRHDSRRRDATPKGRVPMIDVRSERHEQLDPRFGNRPHLEPHRPRQRNMLGNVIGQEFRVRFVTDN